MLRAGEYSAILRGLVTARERALKFEKHGNPLGALRRKRGVLDKYHGVSAGPRIAFLFLSGGERSIMSAAVVWALHEAGLADVASLIFGVSGGAMSAFALATGFRHAHEIYYTECQQELTSFRRVLRSGATEKFLDVGVPIRAFLRRHPCNFRKVFARQPGKLAIGVTSALGEGELLDPKRIHPDPSVVLQWTASIPGIAPCEQYVDGAPHFAFPVEELLEQFRYLRITDVIVIANRPEHQPPTWLEQHIYRHTLRNVPAPIHELFENQYERYEEKFREGVAGLRTRTDINWAILWGDGMECLDQFGNSAEKLRRVAHTTRNFFLQHLPPEA